MTQPRPRRLTFEEFQAILAEELMLPKDKLRPDADLVQDLQVDSLALAAMMLRLEELGVELPLESAWEIRTVGEAYRIYQASLGGAA
ncbi:MAG: phosphopantetheine-binding protein [Chloroflexota bacterium]